MTTTTMMPPTEDEARPGRLPTGLFALAAGVGAFLLVGATVTAVLEPRIEFSLLVGLPAGLVAGALAVVLVAMGLRADGERSSRLALAAGWFGIAFLVVAVGVAVLLSVTLGLVAGAAAGLIAAAVAAFRTR
jgi:hypothetical protein